MNFILIFTLCISTYSIGASSHATTSIWNEWSVEELAYFLQFNSAIVESCSTALQYNYKSTHETRIKTALSHLHQQYTEAVVSCAEAFYDALYPQEHAKASDTEPLSYQSLPSFRKSALFQNDKFHPELARLIKKHASKDGPTWNTDLPSDYFPFAILSENSFGSITHITIPLYIAKKGSLQQTHIHKHDAEVLIPTDSTLALSKHALLTIETGAIFIFAKIAISPLTKALSQKLSFTAYETKRSPTSPLEARPRSQQIELCLAQLYQHRPKSSPSATPDLIRPEPPTATLIKF